MDKHLAKHLVFVYGSLLSGERNHYLLREARLVGKGVTLPRFELLDLGVFPGMVENGRTAVHGEVYEVDEDTLARLDQLERHPDFYVRTWITLQDGMQVWAYVLGPRAGTRKARIVSGDWKKRKQIGLQLLILES